MMKIGISLGVRSYLKKEKSSILMISNFSPSAFEPIMQELAMGLYLYWNIRITKSKIW